MPREREPTPTPEPALSYMGEDDSYIVDLYAVLDTTKEEAGDPEELERAFRQAVRDHHPDRYAHLSDKSYADAQQRIPWVLLAGEVLRDPEAKQAYDARLDAWEGPVSTDGRGFIFIGGPRSALNTLLQDPDAYDELMAQRRTLSETHCGYNPTVEAALVRVVEAAGGPDKAPQEDLDALMVVLQAKQALLTVLGLERANDLGCDTRALLELGPGDDFRAELEAARTAAKGRLEERVAALELGPGQTLALSAGEDARASQAVALSATDLLARYEALEEELREVTEEREAVIARQRELVSPRYPDGIEQTELGWPLLILVSNTSNQLFVSFLIEHDESTGAYNAIDQQVGEEQVAPLATPEAMAELVAGGGNVFHMRHWKDTDLLENMNVALNKHLERFKTGSPSD